MKVNQNKEMFPFNAMISTFISVSILERNKDYWDH